MIGAIDDAVKSSEFNNIWEECKKDLKKFQENIKACKNKWASAL